MEKGTGQTSVNLVFVCLSYYILHGIISANCTTASISLLYHNLNNLIAHLNNGDAAFLQICRDGCLTFLDCR